MDNMKRFVSMLLCLVMVLGFLPVSAVAADASETPLDAALFFSDLHTTASSYKESEIKAVMGGVKTSGLDFSTVTSVGDAFSSNDYVNKGRTTAAITGAIRTGLGDSDVIVNYVWSDHDRGTDVENFTGLMHSGENYYIYAISMSDMSSAERYGQPSTFTEDKLTAFTKTVEGLDHTKPLFIVSHLPLHDRRNDNQYANEWYEVISAAAEQMDVVFLWGHNHTSETNVDTAAYYVAKDGSEKLTIEDVGSVVPNFTYLNAGYLSPATTGSTSSSVRQELVTTAAIYADEITFVTYDANGICTGSDAMNETVVREFAASEPEVPETTAPAETEPVVTEPVADSNGTDVTVAAPGVTNVTVEVLEPEYDTEVYTAYASYDIVLECYTQGDEATVSVPAPASFDANKPVLVLYEGEVVATTAIVDGKITFTTDHFSVYDLAQAAETEGDTYEPITSPSIATSTKTAEAVTVYKKVTTPVVGKQYLIVNSANGSGYGLDGDTNGYTTSAFTGGADYYTTWDEAAQTGTAFSAGSDVYLTTTGAYLWTVGTDLTFSNGNTKLGTSGSRADKHNLYIGTTSSNSRNWSYSGNSLKTTIDGILGDYTYTLVGGSTWSVSRNTSAAVYFYEPVTIYKVTESGTPAGVYSIAGDPEELSVPGQGGKQVALKAELTFDPDDGSADKVTDVTNAATFEIVSGSGIATISGNTLTLSGDIGTVIVKVSYKTASMENEVVNYIYVDVTEYVELNFEQVYNGTAKTIYRLTDKLTAGKKYVIVNRNTAGSGSAVNRNSSSVNTIGVTVYNDANGVYIDAPANNAQWTYTSASRFQNVGGTSYYLQRTSSGLDVITNTSLNAYITWEYSTANGLRARYSSSYNSYRNLNGYYIYAEDTLRTNPVYAAMTGKTVYTYHVGNFDSNEDLIAELKENIHVYTADNKEGTDYTEDLNYTITGNVDCGKVGTYTLTVTTSDGHALTQKITVHIIADPYLQITENDAVVMAPIMRKNVKVGDSVQLGVETFDGERIVDNANVTWRIVEGYEEMAHVDQNGKVVFDKANGAIWVEAEWVLEEDGTTVTMTDRILISVTDDDYFTPSDGTNDFPEFPDKGSIRFDKTAEAVSGFSNTGIAKVELSMTGIPASVKEQLDVVLMLDRSSSMYKSGVQHRIASTIQATKTFVENLVINDDGTFNNNRVRVMDFLGGNLDSSQGGGSKHQYESNLYTIDESDGYEIISSQEELDALFERIDSGFKGQTTLYGTEYARGLEDCYNALAASRDDGNKQFCVFMSDGIPNYMMGEETHFKTTKSIVAMFSGTSSSSSPNMSRGTSYEYEYYSTLMKNEGVTIYTIGLGLQNTNSAWSGATKEACEQVANMLLNDIAGPANETAAQRDTGNAVSKLNKYFFSVADENAAENMADVFQNISSALSEAATDVVVTDKIDSHYNVIFEVPTGTHVIDELNKDQKFYIEVVDYPLDDAHDRIAEDAQSVFKLGLKDTNGIYSAVDGNGNAYAAPVFQEKTKEDQKAFWKKLEGPYEVGENDIIITIGSTTYKFMEKGDGTYNVVSGAYAYGTVNDDNMSTDLVLVTPYFAYSAQTRMLAWTAEKLSEDSELALSYYVYLIDSATEVGEDGVEVAPGPYPTNEWAYITYENFNGNDCRQEFPVPQMTWNGAQVSYVFYLVNEYGEPINKSGQVVDFANAVFVTDVFTEHVVWNTADTEGASELNIQYLAKDKLSDAYTLYDDNAEYAIHVFENEEGENRFNYFIISGSAEGAAMTGGHTVLSDDTTKVYNTKAGKRYTEHGIYSAEEAGATFTTMDANGNTVTIKTTHQANLDYADTTVAFAVLWNPRLVPDVVVVDYGLDVLINVVRNDNLQNSISGIGAAVHNNAMQDTGVYVVAQTGMENLNIDGNTISIENENQVRFHQGDMEFDQKVKFYYESPVSFTENGNTRTGYMYSSVTVIPATTIYYEDDFVSYSTHTWSDETESWTKSETINLWTIAGSTINSTQAQDRPGESLISGAIDADNVYGYDGAYTNMSTYSNGSAKKATVDYEHGAQAQFTFWGTGFDIISLTSNLTGTILVDVEKWNDENQKWEVFDSYAVDTYYGYKQDECHVTYTYRNVGTEEEPEMKWVRTGVLHPKNECTDECEISAKLPEDPSVDQVVYLIENAWIPCATENSIYQVPVIKMVDKAYGHYRVTIMAIYDRFFDHLKDDSSYDFYLDAIRIYDPADDGASDDTIKNAYVADHEGWPSYIELRNSLIAAKEIFSSTTAKVTGMVFIDGDPEVGNEQVSDYVSYGPNNEVYLAAGQSVAFLVDAPANLDRIHIGIKSADGSDVSYTIKNVAGNDSVTNQETFTLNTSTDMYYDMTDYVGSEDENGSFVKRNEVIVITNSGTSGILSITNIKSTYTSDPKASANGGVAAQSVDGERFETYIYMTAQAADVVLNAMKPAPVNPFADVQKEHFFYEAVLWAVENGITNGVNADHFGPFMYCNRAQVVTFLWRAAGSPEPTGTVNPFTDVKESDFFYKAVLWAVENGITNGLTATTFGPNALCNRAQVVTFLWRANGSKVVDGAANPFVDVPADAFYHDAVVWAVKNGITTGASAAEFDPNGICMRAHVVTFLYRAEQLREHEVSGWSSES